MTREKYKHRKITDRIYLRGQRTRSPEKLRWTFKNALKNTHQLKMSLTANSAFVCQADLN